MKKIILLIVLILCIGLSSAFEFDNVKSYDGDKIITIKNSIVGIPTTTIAEVKLETEHSQPVVSGKNVKVAEMTINSFDDYSDFLKEMKFYNINENGKEVNKEFKIRVYNGKYIVKSPIMNRVCSNNQTSSCKEILVSYAITELENWTDINSLTNLNKGEVIRIGIFTDVSSGDYVEWIPTMFGKELNEFATYFDQSSFMAENMIAYWSFNTDGKDDYKGFSNCSGNATHFDTGGVDKGYYNFSGVQGLECLSSQLKNETNNFSVSLWAKNGSSSSSDVVLGIPKTNAGGGNDNMWFLGEDNGKLWTQVRTNGTAFAPDPAGLPSLYSTQWTNIVLTWTGWNGTSGEGCIYVSGILKQCGKTDRTLNIDNTQKSNLTIGYISGTASFFKGKVDEIAIYNQTINQTMVTNLNNSWIFNYSATANIPVVSLISPINYLNTTQSSITLSCSANATSGKTINNITLLVNGLNNYTETFATSNVILSKQLNFGIGYSNWSCTAYDSDSLTQNSTTRFFNVTSFVENSQTFNSQTSVLVNENFVLNISYNSILFTNAFAYLNYNNTEYSSTKTDIGSDTIFTSTIQTPAVTSLTNKTFYWRIVLNNGTDNLFNSTFYNQTISPITFDNCTLNNYTIFNFTFKNELTGTQINATLNKTYVNLNSQIYSVSRNTLVNNFSFYQEGVESFRLCSNSNYSGGQNYSLDLQLQYDADGFASEYYNIQNYTLSNLTLNYNISLYDLSDDKSQVYSLYYKDSKFLAVSGVLAQIQRKYISEGTFKVVEIPKTDFNGKAVTHLQSNDVVYTIIITKNGEILATFNEVTAICQNPSLQECQINLNALSSHLEPTDFTTLDDFEVSPTFNKTSRTISVYFIIPSGLTSSVNLQTDLFDSLANTTICNTTLTSSYGTFTCVIPTSYGNSTVVSKLKKDWVTIGIYPFSLSQNPSEIYGANVVFLSIGLMLMLIFIGLSGSPIITGIFIMIGAVLNIAFNLTISNGYFGATATILWIIIAVVIILIKSSNRQ